VILFQNASLRLQRHWRAAWGQIEMGPDGAISMHTSQHHPLAKEEMGEFDGS